MRIKLSIARRLALWMTVLLSLLFGSVLLVIRWREAETLFDETRSRALLQAQYIADANLQSLLRRDNEAIRRYIESHVGPEMPFVLFYDREGELEVGSELVPLDAELFAPSRLDPDVTPEAPPFFATTSVVVDGRRRRILEVEIPIFPPDSDRKWASVKIGVSLGLMDDKLRKNQLVLLLIGAAGFLVGIGGAAFLARRITRPLERLAEATVRIAQGDFSQTIAASSRDEISDLARSFNEMTAQLLHARERMEAANRQLIQHEKLASIGRLAATIAHEIRNPLTSVKLNVQKVAEEEGAGEAAKTHLTLTLEGIDQIERFIKELLNFTRVQELSLERFSPQQIIEESLKTLRDSLAQKKIVVETSYAERLPVICVDGDKMRQVFLNVLRNAQEALEPGGTISISCDAIRDRDRGKVRVRIADNGPGIPEKDWETIFEPFYSTKPSGFGLGLANARKIVEQHNGSIRVIKTRGRGCTFVILIPAEEGACPPS